MCREGGYSCLLNWPMNLYNVDGVIIMYEWLKSGWRSSTETEWLNFRMFSCYYGAENINAPWRRLLPVLALKILLG